MIDEIMKLINEFKKIAKKGYIKSDVKGTGAIGLTFEKQLNKKYDDMYFPDYNGIEIKCTGRFSNYPISLFSVAFEGPTFPEINRILEKYGYSDKTYKDKKVIFANLNTTKPELVNKKYYFKLDISEEDKKLYLCVYDLNLNLIERESYIYLDTLYTHLKLKLSKLAIINASIKKEPESTSFRYYKIRIYNLISKEKFLLGLKKRMIYARLIARTVKSGSQEGRVKSKNLLFLLDKQYIEKIYDKIYSYDYDQNIEKVNCNI